MNECSAVRFHSRTNTSNNSNSVHPDIFTDNGEYRLDNLSETYNLLCV